MSWSTQIPVARASVESRASYLRKVTGLTAAGLAISALASFVSMGALVAAPSLLGGWAPMILILGLFAVNNFVARPMVFGGAKIPGFILGMSVQGLAMGFLLLAALLISGATFGNPLVLVGLAMGLTFFAVLGLGAYTFLGARNYSMLGAGLSALSIPMLILMVATFAFPGLVGGTAGIVLSGFFVVVSVGAVLYQLNAVVHRFSTDMHWEGAYTIATGILTLFWNILSLLMRLSRRR
jgi:FtsH-binding integral membrane protein